MEYTINLINVLKRHELEISIIKGLEGARFSGSTVLQAILGEKWDNSDVVTETSISLEASLEASLVKSMFVHPWQQVA